MSGSPHIRGTCGGRPPSLPYTVVKLLGLHWVPGGHAAKPQWERTESIPTRPSGWDAVPRQCALGGSGAACISMTEAGGLATVGRPQGQRFLVLPSPPFIYCTAPRNTSLLAQTTGFDTRKKGPSPFHLNNFCLFSLWGVRVSKQGFPELMTVERILKGE